MRLYISAWTTIYVSVAVSRCRDLDRYDNVILSQKNLSKKVFNESIPTCVFEGDYRESEFYVGLDGKREDY
jgi:hypothetical protein